MNAEQMIVQEATRIAVEQRRLPTPFELREIVRDARRYIDAGMEWRAAVDCATTNALRLYGQAPPWNVSE